MKTIKKYIFLLMTLVCLMSCQGKPNPLMSGEARDYLESLLNVDSRYSAAKDCGAYYAGYLQVSPELLEECKGWSSLELRLIKEKNFDMPAKPTIEDFRDKKLWEMLIPKNPTAKTLSGKVSK